MEIAGIIGVMVVGAVAVIALSAVVNRNRAPDPRPVGARRHPHAAGGGHVPMAYGDSSSGADCGSASDGGGGCGDGGGGGGGD